MIFSLLFSVDRLGDVTLFCPIDTTMSFLICLLGHLFANSMDRLGGWVYVKSSSWTSQTPAIMISVRQPTPNSAMRSRFYLHYDWYLVTELLSLIGKVFLRCWAETLQMYSQLSYMAKLQSSTRFVAFIKDCQPFSHATFQFQYLVFLLYFHNSFQYVCVI